MSQITIIPIRRGPPPGAPDALQNIIVHRQIAESAMLAALPQQGAGIALLMSERRALRSAMCDLSYYIDAEEAELSRIAHRHACRHLAQNEQGAA